MHIFLDESGTFAATKDRGSFCVVAAYVIPESAFDAMAQYLRMFKVEAGRSPSAEVKRNVASEHTYFRLLERLARLKGFAVAVATDASINASVLDHQHKQAARILENEPRMIYDQGKQMIRDLANSLNLLSPQNYVELLCRTILAWNVVKTATLYFAQRVPETLGRFSWRFDQKDLTRNRFETTFETVAVALMQSMSMRDPLISLIGADYSAFERFRWTGGKLAWLPEARPGAHHLNAGMIWREDLDFVDSKESDGVQIADLISSGVYGCLRGRFSDNPRAAKLLGRLMVGGRQNWEALDLVSLGGKGHELQLDRRVESLVRTMRAASRNILVPERA
jgi:hypothetical protein